MTRRRTILSTLALLLATFVIAVQHDTFIRRWCLPAPPPATRRFGPLDQIIDAFALDDTRRLDVLRELERRSGLHIGATPEEVSLIEFSAAVTDPRVPRPACTIRRATVEQLLSRILAPVVPSPGWNDPFAIDADAKVEVFLQRGATRQTVARVHAVDPALLRPGVRWTGFPWVWPFPRAWGPPGNNEIQRVVWLTNHGTTPQGLRLDPVLRFGDHLIVVTTPRCHWLIDQVLSEAVEAQHVTK